MLNIKELDRRIDRKIGKMEYIIIIVCKDVAFK